MDLSGKSTIYMMKSETKKYICECIKISFLKLVFLTRVFPVRVTLFGQMELDLSTPVTLLPGDPPTQPSSILSPKIRLQVYENSFGTKWYIIDNHYGDKTIFVAKFCIIDS